MRLLSFFFLFAAPPRLIYLHPDSHITRCVSCRISHTDKFSCRSPNLGAGFLKIHIPLCCWKRTLIFTFLCTYIMTFFKLFHCNVGRFAYSHIKSLKNIYKGKMHVARPCRYFEMIFSMCKQTKNQHIQKQI